MSSIAAPMMRWQSRLKIVNLYAASRLIPRQPVSRDINRKGLGAAGRRQATVGPEAELHPRLKCRPLASGAYPVLGGRRGMFRRCIVNEVLQ